MQGYIAEIVPHAETILGTDSVIVYFCGCDFRCPWCNKPELLEPKQEHERNLREVKQEVLASQCRSVLFTGGEPLLQRGALLSLCRYFKEEGLKVGLETNGAKPLVLKELLSHKLLDFVALDLKSPFDEGLFEKITKSNTFFKTAKALLEDVKTSIAVLKESTVQLEIRTTVIPGMMFRKEDVLAIAKTADTLRCNWKLQKYNNFGVATTSLKDVQSPSDGFIQNLKSYCLEKYPQLQFS